MEYLILALATWRLSSLLANEDGPFQVFERLRQAAGVEIDKEGYRIGSNQFTKGLLCVWCNSVWCGAMLTALFLISAKIAVLASLPLALSAGAIVIDEAISKWQ